MKVYICKVKVLGMPFVTASKERAEAWVAEDKAHYYEEFNVEDVNEL